MKIHQCIVLGFALIASPVILLGQAAGSDNLKNPGEAESIIHTIVNDHGLMLKLIAAIKESDHATMMIEHLMGKESTSEMDHENCPMKETSSNVENSDKNKTSPYAGEESRTLKALSADDIAKYLSGEGMGLAKPAELNRYPGPKHVLDLADQIHLSKEQKVKMQKEFDAMHEKAVRLGKQIVRKEEVLDTLFASGRITEEQLRSTTADLGRLAGELRATHLGAHLASHRILSDEQVRQYVELRGYGSRMDHSLHQH